MWTRWTRKNHRQVADTERRGKYEHIINSISIFHRTYAKNTIAFMRFIRKRWCESRRPGRCRRWKIIWRKSRVTCSVRVETSNFLIKNSASSFQICKRRRLNRGWTKIRWFPGRMRRSSRYLNTYVRTWSREEERVLDRSRHWQDSAAHPKWLTDLPKIKIRQV